MSKTVFMQEATVVMSPDGVVTLEGEFDSDTMIHTTFEMFVETVNDRGLGLDTGDKVEVIIRVTKGEPVRH